MGESNVARATTAAALLLMAGQAEAATIVVSVEQLLSGGGAGVAGQFNIASLLTDADGGRYRAKSGSVVAFGYSDAVSSSVQPGTYGSPTLTSSQYTAGYEYSYRCGSSFWGGSRWCWAYSPPRTTNNYDQERVTAHVDEVLDSMALTAGSVAASGSVGMTSGPVGERSYVSQTYSYAYQTTNIFTNYERFQNTGFFGELSATATLGAADLSALNTSGLLDYTVTASNGQFQLRNLALNLELEQIIVDAVPEPQTWATLVLGFGAAGAAVRRSRQRERRRAQLA